MEDVRVLLDAPTTDAARRKLSANKIKAADFIGIARLLIDEELEKRTDPWTPERVREGLGFCSNEEWLKRTGLTWGDPRSGKTHELKLRMTSEILNGRPVSLASYSIRASAAHLRDVVEWVKRLDPEAKTHRMATARSADWNPRGWAGSVFWDRL